MANAKCLQLFYIYVIIGKKQIGLSKTMQMLLSHIAFSVVYFKSNDRKINKAPKLDQRLMACGEINQQQISNDECAKNISTHWKFHYVIHMIKFNFCNHKQKKSREWFGYTALQIFLNNETTLPWIMATWLTTCEAQRVSHIFWFYLKFPRTTY